jgi:hypothetical protein
MSLHHATSTDEDDDKMHPLGSASCAPAMALQVNGLIPIILYFSSLNKKVVGSIEDIQG